MRSQLRPEVLLGVVVLGLLGLGVGVFALNRSPGTTDDTAAIAARIAAKRAADKRAAPPKKHTAPADKKASTGSLVRIRHALENHSVVVVLFYEPRASYDGIQTREARAGALDADAGFVAVDVSKNRDVAPLARKYGVLDASSLLLVTRRGVATRIVGFAERATVAQAAENAR